MCVTMTVCACKGGVGKSTTTLNLGAALASAGKRVVVVDNDVQANLTAALGFTPAELKHTLAKLLLAAIDSPEDVELHLPRTILHTDSCIDLIPANAKLSDAAARLQVMQLSQYGAMGEADRPCEKIMAELLESLRSSYDYIIIDCGLKHELLTVNALAAADYCRGLCRVPQDCTGYLADRGAHTAARYRCNLCGEHGNSVTLYARTKRVTNREAYEDLTGGSNIYLLPARSEPRNTERQPAALAERDAVYAEMLSFLTLSDHHRANLRERGLNDERIEENGYKSMPEREADRRLLARLVRADHDLLGIPGFYTRYGEWTLAGPNGFLIPVRDKDGLIQGLKIRLDSETSPNRKYRWLSSRDKHLQNGTRSYSWIHVTGDRTRKRAYITEGPLKGDVASYLANDALFVCTGGVNATRGLKETLEDLGITEVVEAMDMDQMVNPQVRNGILTMRKEIMKIPNIKYSKYSWNPAYKGVDDYFLSRVAAM